MRIKYKKKWRIFMKYKNLLNISANPEINLLDKNLNNKNNTFSDMGGMARLLPSSIRK